MTQLRDALSRRLEAIRAQEHEGVTSRTFDRAAGMLAGRVGCPVREASAHLLRMAEARGLPPDRLAADVLQVLEADQAESDSALNAAVWRALDVPDRSAAARRSGPHGEGATAGRPEELPPVTVQAMLNALPGSTSWLVPVRGPDGEVVDYRTEATSPEAVDVAGRRGRQLVGVRVRDAYPSVVGGPLWRAYAEILADGEPRELGPFPYRAGAEGVPENAVYSLRVHRLGQGLLVSWVRHDEEARQSDRMQQTERLADLGWGEWDLLTGTVVWSDQLYRIYERDPADGPLTQEESGALVLPEDHGIRVQAAEDFARGEKVDVTLRVRVGDKVKHLRTVADAVRDATGRPLKVYGIVQDVTARETMLARLAEIEGQLREHQETLRAEHLLATQLQRIILPIPQAPFALPGLRAAVRYIPAEEASHVGGDWFHAGPVPSCGRVILAVGDVAGHGIQAGTTMARLRHALAALIVTSTADPARLLSHLNELLHASDDVPHATATAVVACYEPAAQQLVWAQAGHPAPLRARQGRTIELARPRGPLLGALRGAVYDNARVSVRPGDLLLLYTDGLVEHPHREWREGLAPVTAALDQASEAADPDSLTTLLGRLRRANPKDDTIVLAARLTGS